MPLYIPWLTETIKKRGVRYLLHHYLGQFFEEKLTLDQLSIDIYEGKGSIKNLALDVDGLNDELDFIPFIFLEGCLIGQISVEVPWSSLATDACKVELEGAKFFCRLKTSSDTEKYHCTESTLLSRSLMTSSLQMAEEIVTNEDDDENDSIHEHIKHASKQSPDSSGAKKKDGNQMFEGLEMFAQLIDSVLRRTKLTACNTLFQIQPHSARSFDETNSDSSSSQRQNASSRSSTDEFAEPMTEFDIDNESYQGDSSDKMSESTVEFFIKFFRCEEMIDQTETEANMSSGKPNDENDGPGKSTCAIPETITKLLTLEDVEMRIDGKPVSNLIGKHTITIKFNGHKSEISIFSGSPLLAVISHKQLDTFFNVFDSSNGQGMRTSFTDGADQKMMSAEDYAKIENQLLETASLRNVHHNESRLSDGYGIGGGAILGNKYSPYYSSSQVSAAAPIGGGKCWVENTSYSDGLPRESDYVYHSSNSSTHGPLCAESKQPSEAAETTLDHIEAFSCELKLPGIWLCILRDGEALPPLIKPYADSINSLQIINKYISEHIKVPHIRCLALKVALDITAMGTNIFLGDLDISEHLEDTCRMSPVLRLLHNDQTNIPMNAPRYKLSVSNGRDITIDLLTKTRVLFDPTIIDRIVYDYKMIHLSNLKESRRKLVRQNSCSKQRASQADLNLTLRGERLIIELLCPVPDLTPEAQQRRTQLRPQSFIFDFKGTTLTWQSDKLKIISEELLGYVKTQPMQSDSDTVKFIEATNKGADKICIELEPSPSNLDNSFNNEVEQALMESSMYDSIYVSQTTESKIPTEPFQTKSKVVRASFQSQQAQSKPNSAHISECDHERILTPGDRQHLLDYLEQTVMFTKLSLNLHLPVCSIEFEDKEQLDLIYNRFGNDFVFWQPKALTKNLEKGETSGQHSFRRSTNLNDIDQDDESADETIESEHSFHSVSRTEDSTESTCYDNELTCKITIDELFVRFNHQSCAKALNQEISANSLLMGVVIDVDKKPNTLLSIVANDLELSSDFETVLEGNFLGDKNSTFALTAEIKRPTRLLKDIKLAIQLKNGLFNDIKTETYTRFWQSINVTDEPILGYNAPQIVTELHIDILNTCLLLVREEARPALLSIDELYMTSMVVEQTSQVMIRLIADEVSLYMKRDRRGLETMKNYICLTDSGLIDLDVKFGEDNRLEFGVINNVITVRVCQDSLNALCKLFEVLVKNSKQTDQTAADQPKEWPSKCQNTGDDDMDSVKSLKSQTNKSHQLVMTEERNANEQESGVTKTLEMNLLVDAMNDFSMTSDQANNSDRESLRVGAEIYTEELDNEGTGQDEDGESKQSQSSAKGESGDNEDEWEDEPSDEYDSDGPPAFQRANSTDSSSNGDHQSSDRRRDPNACLLDESNPILGDIFSQPLLPSSENAETDALGHHDVSSSMVGNVRAMDESGFFVIGDDDVGAGIIDKKLQEPVVRELIEGPITIIDNHFKMTKPRTIPEMLANSIQRYVLEEMTLVVNLYGGHDFDDENASNDDSSSTAQASDTTDLTSEANEIQDTISGENQSIRSRAGSIAGTKRQPSSESNPGSLRRNLGSRRKHVSESSGGVKTTDVGNAKASETRVRFGEGAVNLWESLDLMSSPDFLGTRPRPSQPALNSTLKQAGGPWRANDVCIQLTLSKVKVLYELTDGTVATVDKSTSQRTSKSNTPPISWRFMLFIQDIEVKDRIAASDINKMLYEYCTEAMPKRSTQMLAIRNVATINPSDGCEECDLRISLKPLRLNIDQDTLMFLIEFCTNFCKSLTRQSSTVYANRTPSGRSGRSFTDVPKEQPINQAHVKTTAGRRRRNNSCSAESTSSTPISLPSARHTNDTRITTTTITSNSISSGDNQESCGNPAQLPTHCHTDNLSGSANHQAIYIKSFTFSPEVPIRIDYHAKHLDFEQGALAGILMGLAHLNHSELVLRRVQAKHGMRGLDRVLLFAINSWLTDIKRNQLPSLLGGVGPMHSVIQLFQGMRDLVWMPIDHYRKDGRLVRGLQRGASSFSSSTAMAAINLVNRFISIVQCTAQIAHDIVTPPNVSSNSSRRYKQHGVAETGQLVVGKSSGGRRHRYHQHSLAGGQAQRYDSSGSRPGATNSVGLNQPRNFCEGVAIGFTILKEGFNDTARNVTVGMQAEDMRSAVGELVRQIPSTLLNPIISATEGAQSVLVGIRNQIAPDARREDQEKWKGRVRGS